MDASFHMHPPPFRSLFPARLCLSSLSKPDNRPTKVPNPKGEVPFEPDSNRPWVSNRGRERTFVTFRASPKTTNRTRSWIGSGAESSQQACERCRGCLVQQRVAEGSTRPHRTVPRMAAGSNCNHHVAREISIQQTCVYRSGCSITFVGFLSRLDSKRSLHQCWRVKLCSRGKQGKKSPNNCTTSKIKAVAKSH